MAITVIRRFPIAPVTASQSLRPDCGAQLPGSSQTASRTLAPNPIARRESDEITLTRARLARCSTPLIRHLYPSSSARNCLAKSRTIAACARLAATKTFFTPFSWSGSLGVRALEMSAPANHDLPFPLGVLRAAIETGFILPANRRHERRLEGQQAILDRRSFPIFSRHRLYLPFLWDRTCPLAFPPQPVGGPMGYCE